jgi:hypothetical protein
MLWKRRNGVVFRNETTPWISSYPRALVKLNFGNTGSQRKIGKLQTLCVIFLIRQCIAAPKILVM